MTNRDSLQRNEALLLLLSHFTAARTGTDPSLPSWDRVLGETSTEVVSRFLAEGLLHPATLSAKIHSAFSAAEMKVLLKKRGLRVSGTKQDLAARLITADPEGAAAEVAHLNMLECSGRAKTIVERFTAARKAKREATEVQALELLREQDLRGASLVVCRYEGEQVFARGLNIDWTNPAVTEDHVARLKTIFTSRPKLLSGLAENEWRPLRVAAGMMSLWGVNYAAKWLPTDFKGLPKFNHDTCARMLEFHALLERQLMIYRRLAKPGSTTFTILGVASCGACQEIIGDHYSLEDLPELPYERCTCRLGCRCTVAIDV